MFRPAIEYDVPPIGLRVNIYIDKLATSTNIYVDISASSRYGILDDILSAGDLAHAARGAGVGGGGVERGGGEGDGDISVVSALARGCFGLLQGF